MARVEALIRACGAVAVEMDAEAHDRAVAGISHLPLVLAAALAEAVAGTDSEEARADWAAASRLAASGWRDMTRLARGDPAMGAGIVVTNAPALADRLRDLRAVLERWQAELERPGGPDAAGDRGPPAGRPGAPRVVVTDEERVFVVPRCRVARCRPAGTA